VSINVPFPGTEAQAGVLRPEASSGTSALPPSAAPVLHAFPGTLDRGHTAPEAWGKALPCLLAWCQKVITGCEIHSKTGVTTSHSMAPAFYPNILKGSDPFSLIKSKGWWSSVGNSPPGSHGNSGDGKSRGDAWCLTSLVLVTSGSLDIRWSATPATSNEEGRSEALFRNVTFVAYFQSNATTILAKVVPCRGIRDFTKPYKKMLTVELPLFIHTCAHSHLRRCHPGRREGCQVPVSWHWVSTCCSWWKKSEAGRPGYSLCLQPPQL
jgi:hypothetical protein